MNLDSIWNYNDPTGTEKKFRELLQTVNLSPQDELEIKTQLARTYSLRRKFDEANSMLDEVEGSLDSATPLVKVRYLLERGRTYNSSGDKQKAKPLFDEAYQIANINGLDSLAIDALHMLAIVSDNETAIEFNLKAIELANNSSDVKTKKWLGSLYNNTAWSLHDLGRYDEALDLFEKNVKWHTTNKSGLELRIARWCVARTLRSLNKTDEALQMQRDLLDEINRNKYERDGYVYEEIAECMYSRGEKEYNVYFAKAYELLSQDGWLMENESERMSRMKQLSL